MNFLRASSIALPLTFAVTAGFGAPGRAQPPDATDEMALTGGDVEIPQWRPFKLNHIAPSALAAQIDPQHYALAPAWFTTNSLLAVAAPNTVTGALALYDGIAGIVPVDAQQTLLVLGTETETKNLADLIATLDRPNSTVTLQIMALAVDADAAKTLGVRGVPARVDADGNPIAVPAPPPSPFISAANSDAIAQARELAGDGKALILSEQSVASPFPLASSVVLTLSAPRDIGSPQLLAPPTGSTASAFRDVFSLALRAVKNGENAVALSLRNARHLMWVPANLAPKIALETREGGEAIVNVQDGETVAIYGFADDAFPTDETSAPAQKLQNSTMILLIQTRITK